MPDITILFSPDEGGSGAHGDNNSFLLTGKGESACAAGGELINLAGGKTKNITVHKAGTDTGEYNAAYIFQREVIGSQIISQCAIQAGNLIFRTHLQHGNDAAVRV